MSLTGGKRKVNKSRKVKKSLKAWVAFVKKVQKEEKLSYKDAIHRAKVRKDKGEKWMVGGTGIDAHMKAPIDEKNIVDENIVGKTPTTSHDDGPNPNGVTGGRRHRTMRSNRGNKRTMRRRRGSRRR
jgi:hypothetical protein